MELKNDGLKINAIDLRNKFVTKENLPIRITIFMRCQQSC